MTARTWRDVAAPAALALLAAASWAVYAVVEATAWVLTLGRRAPAPGNPRAPATGPVPGQARPPRNAAEAPRPAPAPAEPCDGRLELITLDYDCGCREYRDPAMAVIATERGHPSRDTWDAALRRLTVAAANSCPGCERPRGTWCAPGCEYAKDTE